MKDAQSLLGILPLPEAEVRIVLGANTVRVPPGSQVVTVSPDGGVKIGAHRITTLLR